MDSSVIGVENMAISRIHAGLNIMLVASVDLWNTIYGLAQGLLCLHRISSLNGVLTVVEITPARTAALTLISRCVFVFRFNFICVTYNGVFSYVLFLPSV